MRRVLFAVLLLLCVSLPLSAANTQEDSLYGFTGASSRLSGIGKTNSAPFPDPAIKRNSNEDLDC